MTIGLIGGTGMYDADVLQQSEEVSISTPYGECSRPIIKGMLQGVRVVIIPRHGKGHVLNPSNVNYRANIWVMKELGVERILAPCAVGSLQEHIKPGDLVLTDQFIDMTAKRISTFYDENKVAHVPMAEPFCGEMRGILARHASKLGIPHHEKGVNIIMEGPRFSTRAESALYRSWGASTINMTMMPEVVLAREQDMCYAAISQVTDYDCWRESVVDMQEIITTLQQNVSKTKQLLSAVITEIANKRTCTCNKSMDHAFL
jgi:5'-methylthioadenosine phosphorylase